MKRALLTSTVLLASAITFAQATQQPTLDLQRVKASAPKALTLPAGHKAGTPARVTRSVANGNYFTRPAGSMYLAYDKEGMGYSPTILNLTSFVDATFVNHNADPFAATWYIGGQAASAMGLTDENNNFVWNGYPCPESATGIRYIYDPTLVNGRDTYHLPNTNGYEDAGAGLISTTYGETTRTLTFTDDHVGNRYFGYSDYPEYIFGSGHTSVGDTVYNNYGVRQSFEKPMTPLYVEDVYLSALSNGGDSEPLKNGAQLTMRITGESGNEIATLTCTADDIQALYDPFSTDNMGVVYPWTTTFTQKDTDPISGQTVTVPFVIDEAFTVEITGFDQTDVNLGFFGFMSAADDVQPTGYSLCNNAEYGDLAYPETSGMSLPVYFTAFFDNAVVATTLTDASGTSYEHSNVVRIDDSGSSSYLENGVDEGAYVMTAAEWYDEYQMPNYTYEVVNASDGTGDWIIGMDAIDDYWADQYVNIVTFTATPVSPDEGRWAILNITGRGITSANPIILLQGTATLEDVEYPTGISNVTVQGGTEANSDAPAYNLSGQRVAKTAKGLIIHNGKKYLRK